MTAKPHKSKITRIGTVDENGKPENWSFDGEGHPDAVGITVSPTGNLYGGYTVDELREIELGTPLPTNIEHEAVQPNQNNLNKQIIVDILKANGLCILRTNNSNSGDGPDMYTAASEILALLTKERQTTIEEAIAAGPEDYRPVDPDIARFMGFNDANAKWRTALQSLQSRKQEL